MQDFVIQLTMTFDEWDFADKSLPVFMRARLAQSVEHQTFNLRVMGSSPISGA